MGDEERDKLIKDILQDERKLNVLTQIAFKKVDKDGSGTIEQNELENFMAQICKNMSGELPSKEDVQEVLDDLDENCSNIIEVGQFKAFIKDILKGMIE
jgi:Ca2+-binding EF-hand superfamily protein